MLRLLQSGKSLAGCWAEEALKDNDSLCKETTAKVIYKVVFILLYFCFLIKAVVLDSVLIKPTFKENSSLSFQVFASRKVPGLIPIRALADGVQSHPTHWCNSSTYGLVFLSISVV